MLIAECSQFIDREILARMMAQGFHILEYILGGQLLLDQLLNGILTLLLAQSIQRDFMLHSEFYKLATPM